MTAVLDASAILAFVQGEAGAEIVEEYLRNGAVCSAANWSEVAQKVRAAALDWSLVRALLLTYAPVVESVTLQDAELAARLWVRGEGLSLADRLCLALAARLSVPAVTADRAWGEGPGVVQLR